MEYDTPSPNLSENCSLDLEQESQCSAAINVQVYVCDYNIQKCWRFRLDDTIWDIKQAILASLPKELREGFNYGLLLPPCNGRAGKFLLEERTLRDYPFNDCVPYLEFKYKRRVYKMMNIDEKIVKLLHQKSALKKFWDHVQERHVDKVEKMCAQGFDPNFHGPNGETPLTLAASMKDNAALIMALVAGGAHLDFRSLDSQTALHKAADSPNGDRNIKTLLALGASPNSKDSLNFTPLYRCVLNPKSCALAAEILLRDYSEIGISDVHGNQEIHQACKNGLNGHLEHLLFYGADINHKNVNGNTPLHICAVNNQESCARILLFRGADPSIVNNQGQTAYHVANLIGNSKVADVIKSHANKETVPYRSQPRYNSKRKFTWSRRASATSGMIRHSASSASCYLATRPAYCNPAAYCSFNAGARSSMPTPDLLGNKTLPNEFRTATVQSLREAFPDASPTINGTRSNSSATIQQDFYAYQDRICDTNIPRILVIPRGKKGFGFILRGAKKVDSNLKFQPSAEIPALQYFEGVDTNGMAMKAGLKPGDFLLEINNVDVRCASHEQVVKLIQMASDIVTLKVITLNPSCGINHPPHTVSNTDAQLFARSEYGRSIPNHRLPYQFVHSPAHRTVSYSTGRSMIALNDCNDVFNSPLNERPCTSSASLASKSVDNLPSALQDPRFSDNVKVASVKQRSEHRRVSVVEIEHLMQRQGAGSEGARSSTSSAVGDASSLSTEGFSVAPASPGPRVYASVAEMKRQRRHGANASNPKIASATDSFHQNSHVLTLTVNSDSTTYQSGPALPNFSSHLRRSISEFDTAKYRSLNDLKADYEPYDKRDDVCSSISIEDQSIDEFPRDSAQPERRINSNHSPGRAKRPPPKPPTRSPSCNSLITSAVPAKVVGAPLAPPPPPPLLDFSFKQRAGNSESRQRDAGPSELAAELKKLTLERKSDSSKPNCAPKTDKAKPVLAPSFESDLKLAIAKRRVCVEKAGVTEANASTLKLYSAPPSSHKPPNNECLYTPIIRGSAASLKESVARNILTKKATNQNGSTDKDQQQGSSVVAHSFVKPHNPCTNNNRNIEIKNNSSDNRNDSSSSSSGSLMKKDSGYTSSRNSLSEHVETAEELGVPKQNGVVLGLVADSRNGSKNDGDIFDTMGQYAQADMLSQSRVSVLSRKIEENINDLSLVINAEASKKQIFKVPCNNSSEHDSMSLTSTTSSSMLSNASHSPKPKEPELFGKIKLPGECLPEVPPPDYDLADSGNGDSDQEQTNVTVLMCNVHFAEKPLRFWTVNDVGAWLDSMRMGEYKAAFMKATVNGRRLLNCDRAEFTKLGVTRVAHRIAMENSLRRFTQDDQL